MSQKPWHRPSLGLGVFAMPFALAAIAMSGSLWLAAQAVYAVVPEIAPKSTERRSRTTHDTADQK